MDERRSLVVGWLKVAKKLLVFDKMKREVQVEVQLEQPVPTTIE